MRGLIRHLVTLSLISFLLSASVTLYSVRACVPPEIVSVIRFPETPNYDQSVTVVAHVICKETDIESVLLSYQIDAASWINVTMSLEDGVYVADIPAKPYNTQVSYKVYAFETYGYSTVSELFSYTVSDLVPPVISNILQVPNSPNPNEAVTVSATVTEPRKTSGVKRVTLWYKTDNVWFSLDMTRQDGVWTATIPGQNEGVNVRFFVEAFDNEGNNVKTFTFDYTVMIPNRSPIAVLLYSASILYNDEVIDFDASDSYDSDGSIVSYLWVFGDGTRGTDAFVQHAYSQDGTYIVTLTVTDNDGATDTASVTITVLNQIPTASFTESAETVSSGENIHFDASESHDPDGSIISHLWDFGDGNTAVGVEADHAYEDDGVYTVTLTVIDDDGATASFTSTKNVLNRQPIALFTENATTVRKGEAIQFDASQSHDPDGTIVEYFWDFGDETDATGLMLTHAYSEDGNYMVTLTVTDDDGASSSLVATKIVKTEEETPDGALSLSFLAAIGLGVTALTVTLLYGLLIRKKKKRKTEGKAA